MRSSAGQIKVVKLRAGHLLGTNVGARIFDSLTGVQRGFTLVELIAIIVILGIVSAVAVPRFFSSNTFQERGAADQVTAALRYGQKVAIAQHRDVSVNISSAPDSNCGAVLTGGNVNCVITNRVNVTAATETFNALGQRVPNSATSVTVGSTVIHIEAETGYVH